MPNNRVLMVPRCSSCCTRYEKTRLGLPRVAVAVLPMTLPGLTVLGIDRCRVPITVLPLLATPLPKPVRG